MRTYLDCLPCFLSQALRAGRIAMTDEGAIKHLLDEVGMMLRDIPLESTPPESGRLIYRKVGELTGNPDPYRDIKDESTRTALARYPSLKEWAARSEDPLLAAVRVAIAGNVIDFGANHDIRLEEDIKDVLEKDFAVCDDIPFREGLGEASEVLYIGDNAGECVFDRILIEALDKPVTYAVRGQPIINDATREDATAAGIDEVATVISSGTDAPGTILHTCSEEFLRVYREAPFIISKGQGNYEALSGQDRPIFFLLKIKCGVIAKDMGLGEGDILLKGPGRRPPMAEG